MEMNNVFSKNLDSSAEKSVSRRKGTFLSIARVFFARKEPHCSGVSLVSFKERRHVIEPRCNWVQSNPWIPLLMKELNNHRAAWERG